MAGLDFLTDPIWMGAVGTICASLFGIIKLWGRSPGAKPTTNMPTPIGIIEQALTTMRSDIAAIRTGQDRTERALNELRDFAREADIAARVAAEVRKQKQ